MSQCPGRQSKVPVISSGLVFSGRTTVQASLLFTLPSRQMILMPTQRQFSNAIIWIWSASLSICSTSVWQKNSMGIPSSMKVQQRTALFLSSPEVRKRIMRTMQLEMEGSQNMSMIWSILVMAGSSSFSSSSWSMSSKTMPSKPALMRYYLAPLSLPSSLSFKALSLLMQSLSKMEKVSARQKQLPSLRVFLQLLYFSCRFCTLMQKPSLLTNSSSMREMGRRSLIRDDSASTQSRISSCCWLCSSSCFQYSDFYITEIFKQQQVSNSIALVISQLRTLDFGRLGRSRISPGSYLGVLLMVVFAVLLIEYQQLSIVCGQELGRNE